MVDDERMVAELLAEDGHQVEIATSGADALAPPQDHRVAAVVSDVKMPGLDGPALYERLCRHDAGLRARFSTPTWSAPSSATPCAPIRRRYTETEPNLGAPGVG